MLLFEKFSKVLQMINKYGMDVSEELKEKRYLGENTAVRKRKYFESQRKCDRNVEREKQFRICYQY